MRIGEKKITGNIKIGAYAFEQADKFKYLGSIIDSDGEGTPEIQEKINKANTTFNCHKKVFKK